MYSAKLLDYFEHPRNAGTLHQPDFSVRVENPACGDVLELQMQLSGDVVADICFRAKGCVPAMACASATTELVKGRTTHQALALRKDDIVSAVGGLPEASGHAAQLAVDALRSLLASVNK